MYTTVLLTHSWLRWIVLALGIVLLAVVGRGWRSDSGWDTRVQRLRAAFLGALDLQFALGLLLYALLSPLPRTGWADLGSTLANPLLRFYTIEHVFGMTVAVAVAHIGAARSNRMEPAARYRTMLLTQVLWLVVTLASIPWPIMAYGRPLFRI